MVLIGVKMILKSGGRRAMQKNYEYFLPGGYDKLYIMEVLMFP